MEIKKFNDLINENEDYRDEHGDVPGEQDTGPHEYESDKIDNVKDFTEYAKTVLKEAHGEDYDELKAKMTIDALIDKHEGDYGAMVGALKATLKGGEDVFEQKSIINFEKFLNEENCDDEEEKDEDDKEENEEEDEEDEEKNESKKLDLNLKTFEELFNSKDTAKNIDMPGANNNMPTANKIPGISKELDDIDTKIVNTIKDKGITMSTYKISDQVGVSVDNVYNVLEKLSSKNIIKRTKIGKDNYWSVF
jgi:Fic family protein